MAVTVSDTINSRAEKAVAAYIRGFRDPLADDSTYSGAIDLDCNRAGPLDGIAVHEGRSTQSRQSPCIVVACASSAKPWQDERWYQLNLEITLITHWREDDDNLQKPEIAHSDRSLALGNLLFCEDDVKAAINKPEIPATDGRGVKDFSVMGAWIENQQGEVREGMIAEMFELALFCCPYDAA